MLSEQTIKGCNWKCSRKFGIVIKGKIDKNPIGKKL